MSLQRAYVVSNIDSKGLGRIRFRTTEPEGLDVEKYPIAEYCSPGGGGDNSDGAGFFWLPERGQQIWIMYEGNNKNNPVWMGYGFGEEGGRKNPPIEAKAVAVENLCKTFRTRGGNALCLDDRELDETGSPNKGVRLTTQSGNGISVSQDPAQGIRMGFGQSPACVQLTSTGMCLQTDKGAGVYANDEYDLIKITSRKKDTFLQLNDSGAILSTPRGPFLATTSAMTLTAKNNVTVKSDSSEVLIQGANNKFISTQDTIFSNSGTFGVNANQYSLTGQLGSNYTLDFIVPGDGVGSGNIGMNTAGGNVLLRTGLALSFLPRPSIRGLDTGFGADALTAIANDPNMSSGMFGRMALGLTGNALLEGASGGVFISGIPFPLPGTAGGGGGRLPVPFAPIIPMAPTPVVQAPLSPSVPPAPILAPGPQPAVLGSNLYFTLQKIVYNIVNLCQTMITAAPAFSVSPMGPTVLSPLMLQQATLCLAEMQTILTTNLSPGPSPTNILSSLVFLDG